MCHLIPLVNRGVRQSKCAKFSTISTVANFLIPNEKQLSFPRMTTKALNTQIMKHSRTKKPFTHQKYLQNHQCFQYRQHHQYHQCHQCNQYQRYNNKNFSSSSLNAAKLLSPNRIRHFTYKFPVATSDGDQPPSLLERFKLLTKRYGVSAIVVYSIISTADLALTIFLIQSGGAKRVRQIEEWCTRMFGGWITFRRRKEKDDKSTANNNNRDNQENNQVSERSTPWASILVIAYGIHKILLPLRLGLTAALTPPIVKKLRKMGWNIGKH